MNVVDRMNHPATGGMALDASLLLRTVLGGRRYLVAVTRGRVVEGQVEVGPQGVECLQQVVNHCGQAHPDAALHFAEMSAGPGLARELAQVFERVDDGGAIVFLCGSAETCAAVLGLLNVRMPSPPSTLRH